MIGILYMRARNSRAGLQAVHAWHSDIKNNQVGIEVTGLFESVNAVDSFATNLEPRLTFKEMTGCQAN